MNAKDAKMLVKEYHDKKADEELEQTLTRIAQLARDGKTECFTSFDYERNIQELKNLGFEVSVRSQVPEESSYTTYYDVTWREDV